MAKPAFRLASVLALREAQLEGAALEVARIQAGVSSAETSRSQIAEEHAAGLIDTVPIKATAAGELRAILEYLDALSRQESRLCEEIDVLREQLAQARGELVGRHQAVSSLERLRERHDRVARATEIHAEQMALDEVAGQRAERWRQA